MSKKFTWIVVLLAVVLSACAQTTEPVTEPVFATLTPSPTTLAGPTVTYTLAASPTLTPTNTLTPTLPPTATNTPAPPPTLTPTEAPLVGEHDADLPTATPSR